MESDKSERLDDLLQQVRDLLDDPEPTEWAKEDVDEVCEIISCGSDDGFRKEVAPIVFDCFSPVFIIVNCVMRRAAWDADGEKLPFVIGQLHMEARSIAYAYLDLRIHMSGSDFRAKVLSDLHHALEGSLPHQHARLAATIARSLYVLMLPEWYEALSFYYAETWDPD